RIERPFQEHHARFPEMEVLQEETYAPLPFYSIFMDHDWEKNYRGGEAFRNKIVFIGGSSIVGFHDEVIIPEGSVLGVQLQMAMLAASLDSDFYAVFGRRLHIFSVILMALVAFGIAFVLKRPLLGFLILVGCAFAYAAGVRFFYFRLDTLLPSTAPLLTLVLAGLGCFGSRFALELVEKKRLRRTLERQVSKDLADHILSVPEDYFQSLPGVRKPVTVLFSDIRSFTARSEKDDPVALVSQLKEYLDAMGEIVFEHGGVVDKFIGDAVMAVWGNLRSQGPEEDTRNAVAAAVAMRRRLDQLNEGWRAKGREPFAIGIGLNHGDAIFGMMGSEQKQEMTVIGDPVNQAARLEGLTKKFALGIIVGARVVDYLEDDFVLRSLGKVRTMGKEEAEELAGVIGETESELSSEELEWLAHYGRALAAFQAGEIEEAETLFRACADARPDDPACQMYLESIARGDRGGVLVMTGK
ncbi:MAG: adenylate/guanylate cyclase domain-containing protein, partial [Verrucomicrobiales bacterium]